MREQEPDRRVVGEEGTQPLRVLLCPDKPDWSFDNIANNIIRHAGPHNVSKLYMADVLGKGSERLFFETIFLNRIDICHVFWREDLFHMLNPFTIATAAWQLGLEYETLVRGLNGCAFTSSIYDHLFISPDDLRERQASFAMMDAYTVCSEKLEAIYAAQPSIPAPDAVIPDGVDIDHFSPRPDGARGHAPYSIGWVGNSAWGKQSQGYDVKGYHRLFDPMIKELESRGLEVSRKIADPEIQHIPFAAMPNFYRDLDVFVCTSAMEGTPNPVLEAMACGVPVVSTDVGIVPQAFGDLQKRFMLKNAEPGSLADAVSELVSNTSLRDAISVENRSRMADWTWEARGLEWWPFFQSALRTATATRNATRRESYLLSQAAIL
ncbi:glycosyltransferase family 4 protein [Tepidamorphus sp. 3E244]|uniref:glycosyltransferase family 4 protein n=1 Tax=Tepidamorphus sp. 3E244 TaxID=3385498 RepID=UPI0038FC69F0